MTPLRGRLHAGRALAGGLLVLALFQVGTVLLWVRPGPLSIDEVVYQWMTRSVVHGRGLVLESDFEAVPSPEMATTYTYARDGHVTAQYPYYFPWLAAPFRMAMGALGLFMVNALAFVGVVALTYRIGVRLFEDRGVAVAGAAVLGVATFAWGHSIAAWPHMVTLLTQTGAFALLLEALLDPPEVEGRAGSRDGLRPVWAAAAAGFVLGVGVGFRRDAILFLPVIALPLLYHRPVRGRELGGLLGGTLLPLAGLAGVNHARWGILSPLSYGRAQSWTVPLMALGAVGIGVLVVLSFRRVQEAARRHTRSVVAAAAMAVVAAFLIPQSRPWAVRFLGGMEALLVDLRGTATELGGGPSPTRWAVIYQGVLKKSLLQSLPWLPLVAIPALVGTHRLRTEGQVHDRASSLARSALLLLPALAYIPVQAVYERHGGLGANLRYFLPAIPFLALLGARGIDQIRRAGTSGRRRDTAAFSIGAATAVVGWALLRPPGFDDPRAAESAALDAPLLLAGVLGVGIVWWAVGWWRSAGPARGGGSRGATLIVLTSSGAAFVWAGLLGFAYDAPWARKVRTTNLVQSYDLSRLVGRRAVVLTGFQDWYGSVPDFRDDVVLAFPERDNFQDFRRLVDHYLDEGRPVYGALAGVQWGWLQAHGMLEGLEMRVVQETPARVLQMRRARAETGQPAPPIEAERGGVASGDPSVDTEARARLRPDRPDDAEMEGRDQPSGDPGATHDDARERAGDI